MLPSVLLIAYMLMFIPASHVRLNTVEKMSVEKFLQKLLYLYIFFSINLLACYHEYCSLIGYATHYLFCCRFALINYHAI